MRQRELKRYRIIPNPEFVKARQGFVPVFGNMQDSSVLKRMGKLNKLLESVDNEVLRGIKRADRDQPFSAKMKEALTLERSLIAEITSRKNDF